MLALWIVLGTLLAAFIAMLVVGALLPATHRASGAVALPAARERVFALLTDFARGPRWRPDLKAVDLLGERDGHTQFREIGKNGVIVFEVVEARAPERLVVRIADDTLPFGGTWTWVLTADPAGGTRAAVTEDGHIRNVLFRFMARFIFGYSKALDDTLAALGAHFEPTRSDDAPSGGGRPS